MDVIKKDHGICSMAGQVLTDKDFFGGGMEHLVKNFLLVIHLEYY